MTPKQILDSFSETLMRDERILNARERALLATLLQHAKSATTGNHQTQEAVRTVIASAVGETVAQRAFTVLGASIVEKILGDGTPSISDSTTWDSETLAQPESPGLPLTTPGVPTPGPQHPGVKAPRKEPQGPGHLPHTPAPKPPGPEPPGHAPKPSKDPQSPGRPLKTPGVPPPSPGPEGPGARTTTVVSRADLAIAERPERLSANCVVLDEFLAPEEVAELTRFTLEHEASFRASEVVSPSHEEGRVNYDHRRSKVLMDLEQHESIMLARIKSVLPQVLEKLGMPEFEIAGVEAQVTASNDGDYFHFHSDNGSDSVASRHLTFVYFFHREPRQFEGGELRIHDARLEHGEYVSEGSYQTISPQQNQIVFFPCELLHEITPVNCSSQDFADSRFTLNGWLRR